MTNHAHLIEKLRLESNLKLLEMALSHELQNLRITYDRTCDIIFRLVERALGLGSQEANVEMVHQLVREAMEQTNGL